MLGGEVGLVLLIRAMLAADILAVLAKPATEDSARVAFLGGAANEDCAGQHEADGHRRISTRRTGLAMPHCGIAGSGRSAPMSPNPIDGYRPPPPNARPSNPAPFWGRGRRTADCLLGSQVENARATNSFLPLQRGGIRWVSIGGARQINDLKFKLA